MPLSLPLRSSLWRSLRHRNYRLYLTGQLVSVCGTWMQQVALSWLVYRLTGSATLLGVVGFAAQVPVLALGAIGGVVSDRYAPHRLAVVTQWALLVQAILLSALALSGWIQPWHLILLGGVSGVINAFDMPARQALVYQLVDADDLPNAVALNSSMINAARIVGPGLAGIVIAKLGEGACFFINALSYLAVIIALVAMDRPAGRSISVKHISFADSLTAGLRYVNATAPIRDLLLLLGVVGVMGMPYITLMPVFAADVHKSGADALGMMMGATGCGALLGALSLARRKSILGLGGVIAITTLGFGVALVAFTISEAFWLSLLFLGFVGLTWMVMIAASNTVLQTLADDAMRGRVMSLFTMMLVGLAPFGSLLAGWLADHFGAPVVVAGGGTVCAIAALVFARQLPRLRAAAQPILRARGILSDPANPAESIGAESK